MKTYAVTFPAEFIVEIDADNAQDAKDKIAKAFNSVSAYDPLSNVKIKVNGEDAVVKAVILIQDSEHLINIPEFRSREV